MANFIAIDGRLAADPEIRFTSGGKSVANLRLAHTDRIKGADGQWTDGDTIWDNVTVWGKDGERCAETMSKGDLVIVTGRRKPRTFEVNGEKRTAVDIIADTVALVQKKGAGGNSAPATSPAAEPWGATASTVEPPF